MKNLKDKLLSMVVTTTTNENDLTSELHKYYEYLMGLDDTTPPNEAINNLKRLLAFYIPTQDQYKLEELFPRVKKNSKLYELVGEVMDLEGAESFKASDLVDYFLLLSK